MKSIIVYIFILIFIPLLITPTFPLEHKENPNVLFILLDAARADHFSCYGYNKNTTPNIDTIAKEGAIFLNNFSQGTNTWESFPRIFFSRYFSKPILHPDSFRRGIQYENEITIFKKGKREISLAKVLSLYGWHTVIFSHLQTYINIIIKSSPIWELDQIYPNSNWDPLSSSSVVSSVISWLENNKNRRFFAFCHINVPHYPYPKNDEEKEFLGDKEEADIERMRNKLKKYSGHQNYSPSGWDQNELEILQGFYDCNLKEADKCVGLIYNKLKELNLDKNTVIIITADHGENLGEHGSFGHGGLPFDSVIKVPLIIIYPPLIPKGVKVDGLTESVDIAPTIINACGIKLPFDKSMDGVNLLEFIQNQNSGKSAVFTPESIRTARYKYISVIGALYDVQKDPGEKVNIARENPLIIEELQDSFKKSMQPYLEHYEAAKRKGTPDYPFYFTLNSFKISPRDALEFTNSELYNNTLVSSEETLLKKPYLLRSCSGPRDCGILINPNADSYPVLTLESHLPNGTYHIFILLESLHDTSPFPELFLDFHFRFNKLKPFSSPYRVNFERNYGRSYCYLDLGEIRVNKELFSVEFKPKPLYTKFYVLRYIKFVPKGCKESEEVEELDNEEFRKEKERLKSLGYL